MNCERLSSDKTSWVLVPNLHGIYGYVGSFNDADEENDIPEKEYSDRPSG